TLGGRYAPELTPWPSRRFDAAQSGSSFRKHPHIEFVTEQKTLFLFGGFESGKDAGKPEEYPAGSNLGELRRNRPRGWVQEGTADGTWKLDAGEKMEGGKSLRVVSN